MDDYAVSTNNYQPGTFTYMAWYYDGDSTGEYRGVIGIGDRFSFLLGDAGTGFADKIPFGWPSGGAYYTPTSRSSEWKHCSVVHDYEASLSGCRIYVDGELLTFNGNGWGDYTSGLNGGGAPIYVGRFFSTFVFKGKIAEVAIFNIALSQSQIQEYRMKRLIGTEPGLVRLFHCDEGSGTTCADACGSGDSLTLTNGATWTTRL